MSELIIITGATATGKSDYAVQLAIEYESSGHKAIIISADSRQIYRGLDIGSGKITQDETRGIEHFGLDIADPKYLNDTEYKNFTTFNWLQNVKTIIDKSLENNINVIVVGGTGLYIEALLYGLDLDSVNDKQLQEELESLDIRELQYKLKNTKPNIYNTLNNSELNNKRRLIRKLMLSKDIDLNKKRELKYNARIIIIERDKEELNNRIELRLKKRLESGAMIEEVKNLINSGVDPDWLISLGLEYKYLTMYILNKIDYNTMFQNLLTEIKRYAKRQRTWNKRYIAAEHIDLKS